MIIRMALMAQSLSRIELESRLCTTFEIDYNSMWLVESILENFLFWKLIHCCHAYEAY
jgi:hypothetical protein